MGRSVILNTASKANLAGGAFADTLTANVGDSLTVPNWDNGKARIIEAWAMDSDSVCEIAIYSTRFHDPTYGIRLAVPALVPGGAASVAAHHLLPGLVTTPVYAGDTLTIKASGTAADDVLVSYLTEYDDLPDLETKLYDWPTISNLIVDLVGIQVTAVASATPGAYGAARAFNADDARLKADTYYAILGCTMQTPVSTIAIIGPNWANQRIGLPGGAAAFWNPGAWFVDQSQKWGKPMIPLLSANNAGNTNVYVADLEASTSPHLDFLLAELSAHP